MGLITWPWYGRNVGFSREVPFPDKQHNVEHKMEWYRREIRSASNDDSHGYPSDIYFALIPHTEKTRRANHPAPGGSAYTPYRCLLPQGLDGILVIGLGISMHRDASAIVRMQHDMHNQGYAAGVAAAMSVRNRCSPRQIDALILALGAIGDSQALPAILNKLETLDAGVTLSHHRAVVLALEQIGDPAAAEPLARLLERPGMRGHVMTGLEPLYDRQRERRRREGPLREIVIARALYRCGDHQGLGEAILHEYQQDIRGLFARHATAVLTCPVGP